MKKRPLIIIILGILHLIEPLTKVLFLKFHTGFPLETVWGNVTQIDDFKSFFEFWFLFPVGGVCLLLIKNWTYPLFMLIQFYSILTHMTYEEFTWPYVSETPIFSSLVLLVFNVAMIVYMLLPQVRKPFLDKRVRWWETKKRYAVKIPCELMSQHIKGHENVEILNISKSGVFIKGTEDININERVDLKFSFYNLHFTMRGIVRSHHNFDEKKGWGIEFEYSDWKEKFSMSRLLKVLKLSYKDPYYR